jgi:hypothetical protein
MPFPVASRGLQRSFLRGGSDAISALASVAAAVPALALSRLRRHLVLWQR